MKRAIILSMLTVFSIFLLTGQAAALGTDITINDSMGPNLEFGFAPNNTDKRAGIFEDQEVESGTAMGQTWDLEAMFLEGRHGWKSVSPLCTAARFLSRSRNRKR